MSEIYEGVGTTIAFAITGVTFKVESISGAGGWTKEVIARTNLSNSAWKTKVLAKLKESDDFTVTVEQDPAKTYNSTYASNEQITLTFPDSAGSLVVWGAVSKVAPGDLSESNKPTVELTVTITNLNGSGVETGPAFSA